MTEPQSRQVSFREADRMRRLAVFVSAFALLLTGVGAALAAGISVEAPLRARGAISTRRPLVPLLEKSAPATSTVAPGDEPDDEPDKTVIGREVRDDESSRSTSVGPESRGDDDASKPQSDTLRSDTEHGDDIGNDE